MSTPVTPTATRKRQFNQNSNTGENTEGTGGWLGALGGVVGEWLQGWGLLGVLRKRSGVPGGVRSTPATPPTHSHPSSPSHEHIELRQLNFQCSEGVGGGGGDSDCSRSVLPGDVLRRRLRSPHSLHPRRAPRHSYHEGSTPDSYLLTAVLIHSLKHGSGRACAEPHCHVCSREGRNQSSKSLGENQEAPKSQPRDAWTEEDQSSLDLTLARSVSEECRTEVKPGNPDIQIDLDDQQGSPLSSPTGSFQFAQISPLPSPHSSSITMSSTLSSINPLLSLTSCGGSEAPLLDTEVSSFDISSLTDVTYSSSMLSFSAQSLHQSDECPLISDTTTGSEFSLSNTITDCSTLSLSAATTDCGTLVGSYASDTLRTYSSETIPSDTDSFHPDSPEPMSLGYRHKKPDAMSSSVHSLPSRFTLKDRSSSLRPVVLSSGSLVLLPRRPSLASPPAVSSALSQGHFMWEEVGQPLSAPPASCLLDPRPVSLHNMPHC